MTVPPAEGVGKLVRGSRCGCLCPAGCEGKGANAARAQKERRWVGRWVREWRLRGMRLRVQLRVRLRKTRGRR